MAIKSFNKNLSFADLEMAGILEKTRTQGYLGEIDRVVDWAPIEELLQKDYPVGQSTLGNKAYQPLVLLKAALLQKWYGIDSDPELENQINDRLSFKRFIGIPLRQSAPDHSLISRFRKRISPTVLEKVHSELLQQFSRKGYSIEGGMAIDARLVKSSARPKSNRKSEKRRKNAKRPREIWTGRATR